jgi:hypothetical protein
VLGPSPGALHIEWRPPAPFPRVHALPVAGEPEAFWDGVDEANHVASWKDAVGWREDWGEAKPCGHLNAWLGQRVNEQILPAFDRSRADAWMTDCLHWHCASADATARIDDTYTPLALTIGLPLAILPPQAGESSIVQIATSHELPRLRHELAVVEPETVVTLGNAALRVFRHLLEPAHTGVFPEKLHAGPSYGDELRVVFEGRAIRWIPLAHPAAPSPFRQAHERWLEARGIAPKHADGES